MKSARSFGVAQALRFASLSDKLIAPSPGKEALLEPLRQRNAFLDYVFYDLGILDAEEAASLGPGYAREGAIILVPPTGGGKLRIWPEFGAFRSGTGRDIADCIAVAGVGASALGTAAFARNVADAIGRPVLGVVSGYGLADLLSEALGGFFWFGWLNSLRHAFEPLDEASRMIPSDLETSMAPIASILRRSLDVKTLYALLDYLDVTLLVGHSKGNLVISEALFELAEKLPFRSEALARQARIVTVSAKIEMPRPWRDVIDVMGTLDGFGLMNSRPRIPTDAYVRDAWHHTNTELLFHLPVTKTLRRVL